MIARLRQSAQRLLALFRAPVMDRELEAEFASHLQFAIEENLQRGMEPRQAEREARIRFGGEQQCKESHRDSRGLPWLETLLADVRFAVRVLAKSPSFTLAAILTLALGLGANASIFSVIDAVLLQPLPYRDSNELVLLWEQNLHRGWTENIVSAANFLDWKKQNNVFSDLAVFSTDTFNITGDKPEEVFGERTSTNFFSVLGIRPYRGRFFLPEEERHGAGTVVLSYGLWREHYGADEAMIGRPILINGEPLNVVGIVPPDFKTDYSSAFAPRALLWVSGNDIKDIGREVHEYHAIARMRKGVSLSQAQSEMDTIAARIEQQYPDSKGWSVAVVQVAEQRVKQTRPALLVLLCAVGLVLLIACSNVANLMLVRATKRAREMAVRTALGAGRKRIICQLLVESVVVSMGGGLLGMLFSFWGSQFLARLSPPGTPPFEVSGNRGSVLLFVTVVSLLTGILFGLAPALGAARTGANETLKEGDRRSGQSKRSSRLKDALVVGEFALSLTLLFCAGLSLRAMLHLNRVDLGFDPKNILTLRLPLEGPRYEDQHKQAQFFQQLTTRIAALPVVQAVSVARGIPLRDWNGWSFVTAENPRPPAGEVPDANYLVVGPDYFRTMGITIRDGRAFSEADTPGGQPVVIVSETLARKYWPSGNVLGKKLKVGEDANDTKQPWLSVVGVASDIRSMGHFAAFLPELYVPYTQFPWALDPRNLVIRVNADPAPVVSAIRREVGNLDKDIPVAEVAMLQEVVDERLVPEQTLMWLLGCFAALALILAAVGIYSVMSYSVAERTREIGIRTALGATRHIIARMVLRHGLGLSAGGLALGALGASGAAALLLVLPEDIRTVLLFDVNPRDPILLLGVSLLLLVVAVVASYIPANRAASVEPVIALRYE
jgi:predicted permease